MAKAVRKRKERKNITSGIAHVAATFNNTMITISDVQGNAIAWSSAGMQGFKGSRKSTPYAAQMAAEEERARVEQERARAEQERLAAETAAQVERERADRERLVEEQRRAEEARTSGIASIMDALSDERARLTMTDMELAMRAILQRFGDFRAQLVELGASEDQLAVARAAQQVAVDDLIAREQERVRLAAEQAALEEQRLAQEQERIDELNAAGIEQIMAALADEQAARNLSELDLALRRTGQRFEDIREQLEGFDASAEQLAVAREAERQAVEALLEAERKRLEQEQERLAVEERRAREAEVAELERKESERLAAEQERLAGIADVMTRVGQALEEFGLSDLELQILRVNRETAETVRILMDLEAGAEDVAQAIALGERRIAEARRAALEQELAAIDALSASIDAGLGGLIENIASTLRTDEQNYDVLTARAEQLAQTIGTITDPQQLAEAAREIERLTAQAWGLLGDPAQQQAVGEEFIGFLEQVRELSQEQLGNIRQTAVEQSGIQQAFTDALYEMGPTMAGAAEQFSADAEALGTSVDRFSGAVELFAQAVAAAGAGGGGVANDA